MPFDSCPSNIRFNILIARSRRSAGQELAFAFGRFAPIDVIPVPLV
jgi:hypothetical protein